ncbi:rap1 GTPase-GDP dissociation stimulator 1-B [Papilio machaon]|uniref:rap1 GTPase-GDP dissociation stimulator 1-B n=1 Tax=Papilio machaon TaxID=76193 RepID=UPI001E66507B|nr:rap1 GTPase-GDP dissociation stimulator 1-B [Papilio machaon]
MDGTLPNKSTSLEAISIQNITNVCELKEKLNEIISAGKNYEHDISSCLKSLLNGSDQDIMLLCAQAISELAKCDIKRETYAQKEFVEPLLEIVSKDISAGTAELVKQCCRALGNLCCDCDTARNIILDNNGPAILLKLLTNTLGDDKLAEIRLLTSKTLLNFAIGGKQFSESIVNEGVIDVQHKILLRESLKEVMNDEEVTTALLILSVINDNNPEVLFEPHINKIVLEVLQETSSIEVSELCVEHLLIQAEHEEVKSLVAREGGVQLLCARLEGLRARRAAGELAAPHPELDALAKQACDLIVIVLTGDEAMRALYGAGAGEVYLQAVRWLETADDDLPLLSTALLAVGNFARDDRYCLQMMGNNIYDKLLDIFETYHEKGAGAEVERVQHGALAALRNLSVPAQNKVRALARGRAVPLLARALAGVRHHHVAYKLLAALRMLLDGQEAAARQVAEAEGALRAVARWASAGHAGAAGEAPRLLARLVRLLGEEATPALLQAEGCVASLVGMVATSHAVMQREALRALTVLAGRGALAGRLGERLAGQLGAAELGQQVCVLVGAHCGKLGEGEAEALAALLEAVCGAGAGAGAGDAGLAGAGVHLALRRFVSVREDLPAELMRRFDKIIATISDHAEGTSS